MVQLESTLKQQTPGSLYLVVGEEDLLRDSRWPSSKARGCSATRGMNSIMTCSMEMIASGADIRNSVAAVPGVCGASLGRGEGGGETDRPGKRASARLCEQSGGIHDVGRSCSSKLDGRLKFSQALTRTAIIVDCSPLRDAQLPPWILVKRNRLGCGLRTRPFTCCKEASGASLYGVRRELEKLASYVPPDRAVTAADVQAAARDGSRRLGV